MIYGDVAVGSGRSTVLTGQRFTRSEPTTQDVVVNTVGAYLSGGGGADVGQTIALFALEQDGSTRRYGEPFVVAPGQPGGWVQSTIDSPPTIPPGRTVSFGLESIDGGGTAVRASYLGKHAFYATAIPTWAPPAGVDDDTFSALPLDAAQTALTTGGTGQRLSLNLGWRYDLDEPPGPATCLARFDGPLGPLVGQRVAITANGRTVVVYVNDAADFDESLAAEDGRLSRQAFAEIAPLCTRLLPAAAEVLG